MPTQIKTETITAVWEHRHDRLQRENPAQQSPSWELWAALLMNMASSYLYSDTTVRPQAKTIHKALKKYKWTVKKIRDEGLESN